MNRTCMDRNFLWVKAALLTFCSLALGLEGIAQLVAPFTEEEYGENWNEPVFLTFDDNGRGYVVERHGLVWALDEDGHKFAHPMVDIREEVVMFGDHGLLGFALDPRFESNHYVYLLYVVDRHHLMSYGTPDYDPETTIIEQATIGRITRYTADAASDYTTVDPESRKILLGKGPTDGFPVLMASHGVGSLAFGTDGTLMASCGDAGSFLSNDKGSAPETFFEQALEDGIIRPKENVGSYRAQLVDCLNGKLIRIDPETGEGLPSNPFFDPEDPNSAASKVWALGLRQPYRFIHKPGTGSHNPEDGNPGVFYIGDVGGGAWEELSIADTAGMNFGWPIFEGHEYHWGFHDHMTVNADEPNPLSGDGCEQPYFSFLTLIQQPLRDETPFFANPCDPEEHIPSTNRYFVHDLPAMSWSNEKYNKPTRATITSWNPDGTMLPIDLEHEDSYVDGANFEGSSSIPGCFYSGDAYPEEYRDKLFLCDFTGWIRIMDFEGDSRPIAVDSLHTDVRRIVCTTQNPADGLVYHVNQFNKIYRIHYGGNSAPRPEIRADKLYGPGPLEVAFDGGYSTDPNDDPLNYHWDFGDGMSSDEITPVHVFAGDNGNPKAYEVVLTVTDTAGASRETSVTISVDNTPPVVDITSIDDGALYSMSGINSFPLIADVRDDEHSEDQLAYAWQVFLHHNDHYHPEFPIEEKESHISLSPAGCGDEQYWYRVALTVTDGAGLSTTDEVELFPYCGEDHVEDFQLIASPSESDVALEWGLIQINPVSKFEVERAEKFGHFEMIGETNGQGRIFVDKFPITGEVDYRVKAYRADGIYTYSNIERVNLLDVRYGQPYLLYPNPVSDMLTLFMPVSTASRIELDIFTPAGVQVEQEVWGHPNIESTFQETVDVSGFIPGIYYYKLTDGERKFHGSFVVVD